jgi:hypothetical protein
MWREPLYSSLQISSHPTILYCELSVYFEEICKKRNTIQMRCYVIFIRISFIRARHIIISTKEGKKEGKLWKMKENEKVNDKRNEGKRRKTWEMKRDVQLVLIVSGKSGSIVDANTRLIYYFFPS